MSIEKVNITVYGREQICASCVGAPGSKDTYEWLQAAISRKYNGGDDVHYTYIDIDEPASSKTEAVFIEKIFEEDMFYPIIFVNDELVAEGIPQLKPIYKALEKHGVTA
ncbi:MAG TPA: YuzD family protein [Bacillota bacterium]|nr:YuzD family protein [Bacillota bacterium]